MLTSRISAKGQVTIPKEVREELDLGPGDLVEYELREGVVVLRRLEPFDRAFHAALSETMDEWDTAEDEEAFGDL
ncbi:MAG: AbrB/MazE/SpoVT family DNA-binding domain-containing protein [Deltaproteobacteria bacterium]|nr:AbrB/MazE/SpoVT family DNA-binding domain-containing protein [Deltaproteobacteria bacterium]